MIKRILTFTLIIAALNSFGQLSNTLTSADKVYGLSKFWQEVNYNFVYLYKIDRAKWDSTYKYLITDVQNTKNDYEYYRDLQKFCALLKDGHTYISMPQAISNLLMTTMFGDYRIFIENIDNKAIIIRTNLSKKDEIPIGSEIIEVNGLTTNQFLEQHVLPYITSPTEYALKDDAINKLLQGLDGDKYALKIRRPKGDIITLNLTHANTNEKEVYPCFDKEKDLLDFKWYPNQIAYLGLNYFDNPKIDELFVNLLPELYKAKGLIIDLRYNEGGNTDIGIEILKYLTNDRVLYGPKVLSRLHIPLFKAWGKYYTANDTINDDKKKRALLSYQDMEFIRLDLDYSYSNRYPNLSAKKIVVPTTILIGHNTVSAAEDFLVYADNQNHMIKIGENTYGSTGQPLFFELPGGGRAAVCTKKDTYLDGREFVGYGIKPDIEVKRTINDFLLKKDPVLDKAINYLKTKIK